MFLWLQARGRQQAIDYDKQKKAQKTLFSISSLRLDSPGPPPSRNSLSFPIPEQAISSIQAPSPSSLTSVSLPQSGTSGRASDSRIPGVEPS